MNGATDGSERYAAGPDPYVLVPATQLGAPTGRWYWITPIASFGLLAWLPAAHAASRLDRRRDYAHASALGALVGLSLALDIGGGDGAWLRVLAVVWACLLSRPLRRDVYAATPRPAAEVTDPSVAHVLHGRALRRRAHEIVDRDPLMARELAIGRPDLPRRRFQDGGLVDLNCAPAALISTTCGLTPEQAEAIVTARQHLGSFTNVDEVVVYAALPPGAAELVREYAVLLPP
jgi:hypothetical protein